MKTFYNIKVMFPFNFRFGLDYYNKAPEFSMTELNILMVDENSPSIST